MNTVQSNGAPAPKRVRGFTLIEVMVVVAIVGILAAIAYPSYTAYVTRGKRVEGRNALLDAAARQERYYSDNNQYGALATVGVSSASENGHYQVSIALGSGNQSFTLSAAPETFVDDVCGTLTLTNTGVKGISGGTGSVGDCWGR
jgi:type IV pilus assembly protein PilE